MLLLLGIIMLLAGAAILIFIDRRKFYRRGPAGLQHFKTYGGAVKTTLLEAILKIVAYGLIIWGFGNLMKAVIQHESDRKSHEQIRLK